MKLKIKITFESKNNMYTGQLVDVPEVISEGKTLEELKTNLIEALKLILEVKTELKKSGNLKNKTSALYELSL